MKLAAAAILVGCVLSTAVLGLGGEPFSATAVRATSAEARLVAENWIGVILDREGDWGGSSFATLVDCQELMRDGRALGYFCPVRPQGYIVVSLYKGLAPAKFYSTTCDLDPASKEGMTDLIKGVMVTRPT